ncbi:hypothetical protein [Deinococcus sp. NW-56]|uniref:hypothetical protein n=1 Tax=Deinococcus sp. NW-56 TaxID=2080419 RepID=UPI001319D4F9|nr:hypothetical protein [Deinococcus sp. NW-56]
MKSLSLLALASAGLLLAACDRTPPPSNLSAVSGTLKEASFDDATLTFGTVAWTGGAGSLLAVADDGEQVARTALAADGSFSLSLPRSLAADRLTPLDASEVGDVEGCTGTLKTSAQVNGAAVNFYVDANKDGLVLPANIQITRNSAGTPTSATITTGLLVYVDRGVSVTGSQTCTDGTFTARLKVNWALGQGWNKVTASFTLSDSPTTTLNLTSGSLPADWLYLEGGDGLFTQGAASLKGQPLKVPQLPFFR